MLFSFNHCIIATPFGTSDMFKILQSGGYAEKTWKIAFRLKMYCNVLPYRTIWVMFVIGMFIWDYLNIIMKINWFHVYLYLPMVLR